MYANYIFVRYLTPHCLFCIMAKVFLAMNYILLPANYPHTSFVRFTSSNYHYGEIMILGSAFTWTC